MEGKRTSKRRRLIGKLVDEHLYRQLSERVSIAEANGGKRGAHKLTGGRIICANNRHFARHLYSSVCQGSQQTQRVLVIESVDAGRALRAFLPGIDQRN